MLKRAFDLLFSLLGLLLLLPLLLVISIIVLVSSPGGILYKQIRVGRNNKDFYLYKFRTMRAGSDKKGLLTIGANDSRVTGSGRFLRTSKLDELPQLFNVLMGDMSLVGPRPEVRKYVELYNAEQKKVLSLRPGITDYASILYRKESELLAKAEDPEQFYIITVMPEKLKLNLEYLQKRSFIGDVGIIFKTLFAILR